MVGGNQVHVVYALPADGIDRFQQFAPLIVRDLAGVDAWWKEQDPTRTPRFDLADMAGCDSPFGALDLSFVRFDATAAALDPATVEVGAAVGTQLAKTFTSPAKKYLVYYDGAGPSQFCGQSQSVTGGGARYPVLVFLQSPGDVPAWRLRRRERLAGHDGRPRARPLHEPACRVAHDAERVSW